MCNQAHPSDRMMWFGIFFRRMAWGWQATGCQGRLTVSLMRVRPSKRNPSGTWVCLVNERLASTIPATFATEEQAVQAALPLIMRCVALCHAAPHN